MAPVTFLFVCIGNTCRSPMAEAIARSRGGDRVEVYSAGLAPTGRVSETALEVLERRGIDPSGLSSKGLDEVEIGAMDVVVSLLGERGLAFLPARADARVEAWRIPDPYGEDVATFAAVADMLEARIATLLDDVLTAGNSDADPDSY